MTIPTPPSEVVKDPSKRKVQTAPAVSISAISGSWLGTSLLMFQLSSLGKFNNKLVMA